MSRGGVAEKQQGVSEYLLTNPLLYYNRYNLRGLAVGLEYSQRNLQRL